MKHLAMITAPTLLLACAVTGAEDHPAPAALPKSTIHIDWRTATPFPWTYNGGAIGCVGDFVVYMTGFGRRVPEPLKQMPGYVDGYHRLLAVCRRDGESWTQVQPLFPGIARAYANASTSDGKAAYLLGGQSYAPPYCFNDAYRLSRENGQWHWQRLPDMLTATAVSGCVLLGDKLYVLGGARYAKKGPAKGWDSSVGKVGRFLQVLDTRTPETGWRRLPDLPGTHRSHHAVAAVQGRLYVLGGVAAVGGEKPRFWNCVDNWCYDPALNQWKRLPDLPFPCGGWTARVAQDRYILLFGGFIGRDILNPDGSTRPAYGCQGTQFSNRVLVYDTRNETFSETNPMPMAINDTRVVWRDAHTLMNVTGELPGSRRTPCVFIGKVTPEP